MSQTTDNAPSAGYSVNDAASLLNDLPLEHLEDPQDEEEPTGQPAEDEDDPEGADPETEGDDEADDSDPGEEDEPEADAEEPSKKLFEVPGLMDANGKPQKVTLGELQNGYLRQQDYTRKTQAVAEARKHVESEWTEARGKRQSYSEALDQLNDRLAAFEPTDDQIAQLRTTDPIAAAEAWQQRQQIREHRQKIDAEKQRTSKEAQEEQQKQYKAIVQREGQALSEKLPEWRDEKVRKAERDAIMAYGQKMGFSPEELSSITDHRVVLTIRQAMKFDALQAQKGKAKPGQNRPPRGIAKPGSTQQTPPRDRVAKQAVQRAKQTGRVQDAAAAIMNFLD